jgi:DNA-binding IclR family transcriptional regulator
MPSRTDRPSSERKDAAASTKDDSTLIRGLKALEAVSAEPRTASDIARLLNVNRSSALRMMQELELALYVSRDPHTKTYSTIPSRFVGMLGNNKDHADWSELLDPVLASLRDEFHESTIAGVPANGVMVYTSFFPSSQPVAVREQLGTVRPMHASALGKAYLAAVEQSSLDVELGRLNYDGGTIHAPRGPLELRRRLEEVREVGYAVDREETFLGVGCVAVAARIGGVLVGAAGVSGPASRIEAIGHAVIGRRVLEALTRVSASA